MTGRAWIGLAWGICSLIFAVVGWFLLLPKDPTIVKELRGLPEVARVDYAGPSNAALTVVHIRDWHLAPKELAELDGLDYPTLLDVVEKVQRDELAIMRFLIRRHGIKAVYSEGLSKDSMAGLTDRLDVLRDIEKLAALRKLDAGEQRQQRELALTIGTVGRLLLAKENAEVLPLEDEQALQNANPVVNGKVAPDKAKVEARNKAMVKNLPREGLAVVILGGSHNLEPYLPAETLYVWVTPRSYPE